jgi:hypothetical protein
MHIPGVPVVRGSSVNLRFDGFYLSTRQRHGEWHAGVHMVEEYFQYFKFFANGICVDKSHKTCDLDFMDHVRQITEEELKAGLEGHNRFDESRDFVHRIWRYSVLGDRLEMVGRHFLIIMHEFRLEFRVRSRERFVSEDGTAFTFQAAALV